MWLLLQGGLLRNVLTLPGWLVIRSSSRRWCPYTTCRQVDGGTLVTTQCLYPGGDGVSVVVGQGAGGYRVSDDGAGWEALLAAGMEVSPSTHGKRARSIAETMGVEFRSGSLIADVIADTQLGAAIVIVANAASAGLRMS